MCRRIILSAAVLAALAFGAGPVAAYSVVTGSINLAQVRIDKTGRPKSTGVIQAFTTTSDSTFVLGYEACTATVGGGTVDVKIEFIGDDGQPIEDPGQFFTNQTIANPVAGQPSVNWTEFTLAAGKSITFAGGGLRFIRIHGTGSAGTVNVFATSRCQ